VLFLNKQRKSRQWLIVMLSVFALFALPRTADACDCARSSWQQRLDSSDVIFVGRVVQSQPLQYVELEVRDMFKGHLSRRIRVVTGYSDCDYFLPPVVTKSGNQFLIYGTVVDGKVTVSRLPWLGATGTEDRELRLLRQRTTKLSP
jgi:hypothetical protein